MVASNNKWKLAGVFTLLVPIIFFLVFAIGEGIQGWSHYLQALLPLVLLAIAWWWPRVGGAILVGLGVVLGVLYAVQANSQAVSATILVGLIVFAPIIISGVCFLRASYRRPNRKNYKRKA